MWQKAKIFIALLAGIAIGMWVFALTEDHHEAAPEAANEEARVEIQKRLRDESRERLFLRRIGECKIAIVITAEQERHERGCEAEVEANFARGVDSPPLLRAGRFR